MDHPTLVLAAIGFGGFGLGVGLVLGAFVARTLRRYIRDESSRPHGDDRRRRDPRGDDERNEQ